MPPSTGPVVRKELSSFTRFHSFTLRGCKIQTPLCERTKWLSSSFLLFTWARSPSFSFSFCLLHLHQPDLTPISINDATAALAEYGHVRRSSRTKLPGVKRPWTILFGWQKEQSDLNFHVSVLFTVSMTDWSTLCPRWLNCICHSFTRASLLLVLCHSQVYCCVRSLLLLLKLKKLDALLSALFTKADQVESRLQSSPFGGCTLRSQLHPSRTVRTNVTRESIAIGGSTSSLQRE